MFFISLLGCECMGRAGQLRSSSYLPVARLRWPLWQAGLAAPGSIAMCQTSSAGSIIHHVTRAMSRRGVYPGRRHRQQQPLGHPVPASSKQRTENVSERQDLPKPEPHPEAGLSSPPGQRCGGGQSGSGVSPGWASPCWHDAAGVNPPLRARVL